MTRRNGTQTLDEEAILDLDDIPEAILVEDDDDED